MTVPFKNSAPEESILPSPARQRLSIAHLLLWMAGTAIALAFFRTFFAGDQPAGVQAPLRFFALLQAPIVGAALGSLPLAVWQALHGKRGFPHQPGHWLLVLQGISFLAGIIVTLITQPAEPPIGYSQLSLTAATREFWRLVPTLAVTLLVLTQVRELRWRWMFGLMAIGYGTCVFFGSRALGATIDLYHLGTAFLWLFQTSSAIVLVGCVIIDRNIGIERDFLHSAGVVVRLAAIASGWLLPWLAALASNVN